MLIVGDASSAYRYYLASLAVSGDPDLAKFAHLEIDLPKIVEGHTLLGQVQEYWQKQISKPALGEDIILYITNLSSMIGLGASNRSSTGVETLFAPNIQGGKMRSVAFIDYFNYSRVRSDNNYVINSFGDTVFLPEYGNDDINGILLNYARAYIPQLKLTEAHVNYIKGTIGYYQPNKPEPQRTLTVFKELVTMMEEAVAKSGRFVMDKVTLKAASMKAAQVPDWIIQKDFSMLKALPGKIRSRFIGQDEAVNGVVRLSRIGYGGGRTDEKPVASIMFAGPTGTGKTYLSKLLSKNLGLKMITMDMTSYRSSDQHGPLPLRHDRQPHDQPARRVRVRGDRQGQRAGARPALLPARRGHFLRPKPKADVRAGLLRHHDHQRRLRCHCQKSRQAQRA